MVLIESARALLLSPSKDSCVLNARDFQPYRIASMYNDTNKHSLQSVSVTEVLRTEFRAHGGFVYNVLLLALLKQSPLCATLSFLDFFSRIFIINLGPNRVYIPVL